MIYQMKQKLLCFGDDFVIRDEAGHETFYVDGRAFSLGDKLSFQDMRGTELALIRQRLLTLGKTYDITKDGRTATVHRKFFTFVRCKFEVDLPGPDDLEASGNLFDMEYRFVAPDGRVAATVSKRWFTLRDTYGVDVADGWDPVFILASVVVIDLCCHGDKRD